LIVSQSSVSGEVWKDSREFLVVFVHFFVETVSSCSTIHDISSLQWKFPVDLPDIPFDYSSVLR